MIFFYPFPCTMSSLSLFKQAEQVVKPWECNTFKKRFLMKANAANHHRQASSAQCRTRGFCRVSIAPVTDEEEIEENKSSHSELKEVNDVSVNIEECDEGINRERESIELPFGPDDEKPEIEAKKVRMSRRGIIKSTPYKISQVLRRMEELAQNDSTHSNRVIASKVGEEFSTHWRNCYR